MDTDENVINNFAYLLRNYHVQRTVSLYGENRSVGNSGGETYEIKDVISGVAKQLKAIQNADSFRKHPSGKSIPNFVKKSTFLPVHMVPVEHPLKEIQSHKFETQCVLDTQLMDIIDNAEAIMDAEKGITQEFNTTFYHKDIENCKAKSSDCEIFNTSQNTTNTIRNNDNVDDKGDEFQSPLDYHLDRAETNHQLDACIMSENETVKHYADKGMTQEFCTTFCPKNLDENIKQKNYCHANQENDVNNVQEKNMKNVNILAENCREKECVWERKNIGDIISREFVPKTDINSKDIDLCDNFDTQLKFYCDRCEDDNISQSKELTDNPISKTEEPSSPILNKIGLKVISNTPSPLIFELESFEKFETLALPVIEKHDFETAKRVINSQILNRELFIHTHAKALMSDRDKGIQKSSPILNHNIKSESLNMRCTDSQLHLKEDSMLFSSDEENDVQKKIKELPLTCTIQTIQNSCNNNPDILDKNMYVGFQTASNKSIQISTESYCKAKSIFDNFDNIAEENLSEMNIEALTPKATKNINEIDYGNMHNATNNNADDIAYVKSDNCATCNISQNHSNVFEHIDKIFTNEDKIIKQQISKPNTDVQLFSTSKAKNCSKDSIFTEHLKIINYHVLEEFDKNLTLDMISNKFDKLPEDNVMDRGKVPNPKNETDNEIELDLNVIKPINNDFVGFRTANNKMIQISSEAQIKTKNIFENINSDDNLLRKCEKQSFENPLHRSKSEKNINNLNKYNKILSEKPLYPVLNTDSNAFQGFKTASNKPVKISETALAKTKNIFNDIDNNLEENVFKIPQCEGNSILQGFKTANNKSIPITMKQLAKSKELFQDIFDTKAPNAEFSNFRNESLALLNDSSTEKPRVRLKALKMASNKSNLGSFQTVANKPVEISAEALAKSKKIFQDIDNKESHMFKYDSDNILKEKQPYLIAHTFHNAALCQGFKTAGNKPVGISAEALAKSKKIFQDIDEKDTDIVSDFDDISKEKQLYPSAHTSHNAAICQGFKTAGNKPVGISAEALAKSKKMFQDIDEKDTNIVNDFDDILKEKQLYPSAHTSHNTAICQGFKTAGNKPVGISAEALAKSKKIFQDIDEKDRNIVSDFDDILKEKQLYPSTHTSHNAPICQGFKTAGNKPVGISAEALAKSKKIFQDIDEKDRNIVNDFDDVLKEKQLYPLAHTSHNAAICQGFKTAANKPVGISAEALAKSSKIFQGTDTEESNIVNDSKRFKGQQVETSGDFIGFNTASNKKVKVSENALIKSREVLQKSDSDMKNGNHSFKHTINKSACKFGFQTGNNTHINVSEEALRKSKNLFSDIDECIKANLGPKLKELDDVISENDILEDFNTEIIKDFEETVYTEDFIKNETLKSKRSGSPILSCPKSKKRKKFETPVITNKFIAPVKRQSIIKTDTTNVYSFNENYKKHKNFNLKDVNDIEKLCKAKTIDSYILNLQFEKLLDFEFINDRNDIDNDKWTTDKIKRYFTDSVNKRIIPSGWIDIHLKMIIWKLVSYEIRFPGVMKNICSVKNVLEQLKYRYKRELYNVERPVLRKILEKDEVSSKMMILCVAGLFVDGVSICSVANQTQNIELLLTDGWYTIKASTDRMIDRLVCEGKISVGTKLAIQGAELMNCEQGIAPWEDTSSIRLKISGNSTRRAKWDARLGLHGNGAMLSRLSAVKPEGGRVSRLRTLVTRVYPTLYIEKFSDGSTLTRSERLEHIYQMKYETEQQIKMEKLYEELEKFSDQDSQDSEEQCTEDSAMESGSQISRLMKKSRDRDEFRANLTSSQAYLLQQHALKQKDKLVQALQDKFLELVKKRGLDTPRNVVPLMKIRVADVEAGGITKAMVTIWKPNENLQEMLTEGTWIDLYNVVPTSVRYNEIQISAGRQSVFRRSKLKESDKLKTLTNTLRRQCYTTKYLQNPSMNTDYNEVDTVGLIFMIEPKTLEFETSNQPFQNVYLTDVDKNIICVNFWGGIKKFGFQNILDTGQVVACVNLQKRAGNTRKNIPQYRATEFTYFTKTPKNDSVRKLADDLAVKFSSLDRWKFIDDCVALKNNYHNLKCGNTENVSPYRLNTSDYNVYKNKVFIDSPLVNKCTDVNYNLTGLDFESTFKQTDTQNLSPQMLLRKRKVNEKIAKLKMYGEPPPLSPIHMLNKSSNTVNAFKSPLTRKVISTNVASPNTLPQNREENKCIEDNSHQNNEETEEGLTDVLPQNREYKSSVTSTDAFPQNRINKINSSPVLSLNRTYVKRASINPVKLNFSNAIETSFTDPFAEDFDSSPPLSLDVDFVT